RSDQRFSELLKRVGLGTSRDAAETIPTLKAAPAITAHETSFVERFRLPMLIAAAIILLLIVGYVSFKLVTKKRGVRSPEAFNFHQLTYQSGPEFFPTLSPDGRSVAYSSHAHGNWDIY